jgi:hypothetical protein
VYVLTPLFISSFEFIPKQLSRAEAGSGSGSVLGKPLTESSPEQWKKAALEWTKLRYKDTGVTPKVLIARAATAEDLKQFGAADLRTTNTPAALVALEGRFEDTAGRLSPGNYLLFILNLQVGLPSSIDSSWTGEGFRKILNMPVLGKNIPPLPPINSEIERRLKLRNRSRRANRQNSQSRSRPAGLREIVSRIKQEERRQKQLSRRGRTIRQARIGSTRPQAFGIRCNSTNPNGYSGCKSVTSSRPSGYWGASAIISNPDTTINNLPDRHYINAPVGVSDLRGTDPNTNYVLSTYIETGPTKYCVSGQCYSVAYGVWNQYPGGPAGTNNRTEYYLTSQLKSNVSYRYQVRYQWELAPTTTGRWRAEFCEGGTCYPFFQQATNIPQFKVTTLPYAAAGGESSNNLYRWNTFTISDAQYRPVNYTGTALFSFCYDHKIEAPNNNPNSTAYSSTPPYATVSACSNNSWVSTYK